jgi:hypothetical protein
MTSIRRWNSDDIEKLRRLAGTRSAAEIASELGRTRGSVTVKAHQLKLSLRSEPRLLDDKPLPHRNETRAN